MSAPRVIPSGLPGQSLLMQNCIFNVMCVFVCVFNSYAGDTFSQHHCNMCVLLVRWHQTIQGKCLVSPHFDKHSAPETLVLFKCVFPLGCTRVESNRMFRH